MTLLAFVLAIFIGEGCLADPIKPTTQGDNFAYFEDVTDTDYNAKAPAQAQLVELKDIPTAGYKTVRIFFSIYDFPKLEENPKVWPSISLSVCHDLPASSTPYKTEQVAVRYGVGTFGVLEAPIIGTKIRILITGLHIPDGKIRIASSIYLLK